MPPKRKNPASATAGKPPKALKSEAILAELRQEFGPLESIDFQPFQPEEPRPAFANLPPTFLQIHS